MKDSALCEIAKGPNAAIRVSRSTFRGKERVDVREFFRFDAAADLSPTKKGINLPLEQLPQLIAALRSIEAAAIQDGTLLAEDYEAEGLPVPVELGG